MMVIHVMGYDVILQKIWIDINWKRLLKKDVYCHTKWNARKNIKAQYQHLGLFSVYTVVVILTNNESMNLQNNVHQ